ncbi:helix-turn-helix transcriptional regulator [Dyadobacter sp. CY261]|uniref:winged helix-turn-helix transcriptional regulator n=1 Tax=Dyadobacter sp. CY261 TaxID=2907203 RepID=UPI001F2B3658|nr:helix-turn-helix domain-containing protein [Dyadobacter sp. CY261]MCF0072794.1 helix-turn-helix transcriptional regulator [Dyadobacter sp. CY261]
MEQLSKQECSRNRRAVQDTLDLIGGKWKVLILLTLKERPYRFKALAQEIGISPRMLSRELQDMEINKLLDRTVIDAKPIGVEYSITDYGRTFGQIIEAMRDWGLNHRREIFQ